MIKNEFITAIEAKKESRYSGPKHDALLEDIDFAIRDEASDGNLLLEYDFTKSAQKYAREIHRFLEGKGYTVTYATGSSMRISWRMSQ